MANLEVIERLEYRASETSKAIINLYEDLKKIKASKDKEVSDVCKDILEELNSLEIQNEQLKQDVKTQKSILVPCEEETKIPHISMDFSGIYCSKLTYNQIDLLNKHINVHYTIKIP